MHCSRPAFTYIFLVPTQICLTAAEPAASAESKQRYWAHPLVVETSWFVLKLKLKLAVLPES